MNQMTTKDRYTKTSLSALLQCYKKENNEHCLLKLLQRFNPLISKYTRKLSEEYRSDFVILCIECFNKMPLLNDACIINYIHQSCHNKYINLSKALYYMNSNITYWDNMDYLTNSSSYLDSYDSLNLESFFTLLTPLESQIIYTKVFEDLTDAEIAQKLSISRQYVQKIKVHALYKLKTHYPV